MSAAHAGTSEHEPRSVEISSIVWPDEAAMIAWLSLITGIGHCSPRASTVTSATAVLLSDEQTDTRLLHQADRRTGTGRIIEPVEQVFPGQPHQVHGHLARPQLDPHLLGQFQQFLDRGDLVLVGQVL